MINLYKMPGAFIFGFHGNFGTGKTLGLVEQGIITASKNGLNLVSSFDISQYWVNRYCEHKKLKPIRTKTINIDMLEDEIKRGRERIANGDLGRFSREWIKIYEQDGMTPLLFLFSQEKSVILLDEAGLALFSRNFKDTSRSILFKEMFQLRKGSSFLFFSCQHLGQIDKQLRDNTHVWLLCKGLQKFNAKKKRSILISRSVVAFSTEQFEVLMSKPQNRNKLIYPIFLSGFKFSTSNLMLSKFLGLISHLRKGLSYARKKTKSKKVGLLWAIFYEMHSPIQK